jgi:hypothetical protein
MIFHSGANRTWREPASGTRRELGLSFIGFIRSCKSRARSRRSREKLDCDLAARGFGSLRASDSIARKGNPATRFFGSFRPSATSSFITAGLRPPRGTAGRVFARADSCASKLKTDYRIEGGRQRGKPSAYRRPSRVLMQIASSKTIGVVVRVWGGGRAAGKIGRRRSREGRDETGWDRPRMRSHEIIIGREGGCPAVQH